MNTMIEDFFSLEAQSRGTKVGFSCLYHLISYGNSGGPPTNPSNNGKRRAMEVLAEHYCDYEDVDVITPILDFGTYVPGVEDCLRKLATKSKHDYVRANATFNLAKHLVDEAALPVQIKSMILMTDKDSPDYDSFYAYYGVTLEPYLSSINVDRNREEASQLVILLKDKYPDHLEPPMPKREKPILIEIQRAVRDLVGQKPRRKIVDLLPKIEFGINYGVGRRPPIIEGNDAMGAPMKLSDFAGRVIVIMFSFKGCGPCEREYPGNRDLINELKNEPFTFVGVQSDESVDTVVESLKSNVITWRVWWEDEDKPISNLWNVRGYPRYFIIDKQGILRFDNLRDKEVATAVKALLKE